MGGELIDLVLNAGGESRRMGQTKALLPMPPEGEPLFMHILDRLAPLVSGKIIVVSNDPRVAAQVVTATTRYQPQIEAVRDSWPSGGALGGIATGLSVCAGWAMVVACDMPLVEPAIFMRLLDIARQRPALDAIVPRMDGQPQPFHALWHRRTLTVLSEQLENGVLTVNAALARLEIAWMDATALGGSSVEQAFMNINTPGEWQSFLARCCDQSDGDNRETGR